MDIVTMATLSLLFVFASLVGQANAEMSSSSQEGIEWRHRAASQEKIVGGIQAASGEFPFLVSVKYGRTHFCGGSIVDETFILTAAHCVYDLQSTPMTVVAGEHDQTYHEGFEQEKAIKQIHVHSGWNPKTFENDVALLELKTPLDLTGVRAVRAKLAIDAKCENGPFTVAGWGATKTGGPVPVSVLRKVNVNLVSTSTCSKVYSNITYKHICAAATGKDSCQGDSGGPLFNSNCGNEQVGVVSRGEGCAKPGYPGVYTRVSSYIDWIQTIIKGTAGGDYYYYYY